VIKAAADSPEDGFQFFLLLLGSEDLINVLVGNR